MRPIYDAVVAFGDSTAARHLSADIVGASPRLALSPRIVRPGEWLEASDTTVTAHDPRWLAALLAARQIAALCEPVERLWECGARHQRMAAAVSALEWDGDEAVVHIYLSHPEKPGMRGGFHVVWRLHLSAFDESWRVVGSTIMSIT
jgi:hypothetical protein